MTFSWNDFIHRSSSRRLTKNGISEVESHAFNGTKIHKLFLMGNLQLSHMHNNSFKGAEGPGFLDISRTALSSLPESVLGEVEHLSAVSVFSLRALPPMSLFTKLRQANLTYPSHCCAFHKHQRNRYEDKHTLQDRIYLCILCHIYSALRKYSAPLNFATFCHISGFKH
ncbi:unnamed protein product, partial [Oncorhynchus mykiss]